jgi:transposase-like protein
METKRHGIPKTLQAAIRYFSDPDNCLNFAVALRWPNGVACPTCGSTELYFLATRRMWKCKNKHPKQQFSVKIGTIFEDSPIGLDKWFTAMWLIVNCKNGVSSWEIHRSIGVCQKTAWFMNHRLRMAIHTGSFDKLSGEVEADESFIGGLARFMHADRRAAAIKGTGGAGKTAVMGLLERHGPDGHSRVRTKIVPNVRRRTLHREIRDNVQEGSEMFTDALNSYRGLEPDYTHNVIDHAERYVDGNIHTNGMENFWSLLKRGIKGTYVSVEPFHLYRYLDEQVFRFNNRKTDDGERFVGAMSGFAGKRLTYKQLTGKQEIAAPTAP